MKHDEDKPDIGCLEAIETLYAWLDGELDDEQKDGFEHHLSHCKSCYSRAELERSLTEHIRKSSRGDGNDGKRAPGSLQDRLSKLIDKL